MKNGHVSKLKQKPILEERNKSQPKEEPPIVDELNEDKIKE